MKKILHKVLKRRPAKPETGGRITNETVAEHRERVLAGGRKFKYPLQYTKHRVLVISVALVVFVTISFLAICAWQLYGAQNTGRFMYSLTQFVPVPVARVEGQWVRYSDYLSELRSSIHYLTTKEAINFNSDDGARQLEFQKRLALDKAVSGALVSKLAREHNISVSQQEVDEFIESQIQSNRLGVNEVVYRQVIRDYYDWSFDEYKNAIRSQLLRKNVMSELDTSAQDKIKRIVADIDSADEFAEAAENHSEDVLTRSRGGDVGFISLTADDPNGLIDAANQLNEGQISDIIQGVDGLYVVQLLEKREGGDVRFAKIYVSYTLLSQKLDELRQQGEVQEFIEVEELTQPSNR